MQCKLLALWVCLALPISSPHAIAAEFAPAKALPPLQAAKWIDAVKSRKTADGATVIEVLRFAEKMRPRRFKVETIDIGYNGGTGEPDYVSIGYWIGVKRLPGDVIIDLGYNIKRDGLGIEVTPRDHDEFSTVTALENGRDTFLRNIDRSYKEFCVDPTTKAKDC